jgi:hypothetical protein
VRCLVVLLDDSQNLQVEAVQFNLPAFGAHENFSRIRTSDR